MPPTYLTYHHNALLRQLKTRVTGVYDFKSLAEASRSLFTQAGDDDYVVITSETIFHPQGGGQPSDVGKMQSSGPDAKVIFEVSTARHEAEGQGQVLHLGRFIAGNVFREGDEVEQHIDSEKRDLYSRLHTGGHVLGAAVRHLLEKEVEGFDELKASHFPDSASCEFKGLIDGKYKEPIQAQCDKYVKAALPVEIRWWTKEDFEKRSMAMPDASIPPPWRVVEIVGAEQYPCGGTHVADTSLCGPVNVKKISRKKGISRVSYTMK